MGCGPSQAVIIQPAKRNSDLQPKIFMVADDSFQLLRELGELKFYQLAQYGETEDNERRHGEFACRLENPVEFVKNESSKQLANDQIQTSEEGLLALSTKNLKTKSILSHIFKAEETSTEVTTYSIDSLPATSSTEGRPATLVTTGQGLSNSTFYENAVDMLENPVLFQRTTPAANVMNDVTPWRSKSPTLRSCPSPQKPGTSKPKGKTLFRRNRAVQPKQRSQGNSNQNHCFQPLSSMQELQSTVRGKLETALDEENTVQEITLQKSAMSNPACSSDTNV